MRRFFHVGENLSDVSTARGYIGRINRTKGS